MHGRGKSRDADQSDRTFVTHRANSGMASRRRQFATARWPREYWPTGPGPRQRAPPDRSRSRRPPGPSPLTVITVEGRARPDRRARRRRRGAAPRRRTLEGISRRGTSPTYVSRTARLPQISLSTSSRRGPASSGRAEIEARLPRLDRTALPVAAGRAALAWTRAASGITNRAPATSRRAPVRGRGYHADAAPEAAVTTGLGRPAPARRSWLRAAGLTRSGSPA